MNKVIILILLVFSNISYGGIYKWVDEQGKVHFGDNKPQHHEAENIQVEINSYTNVTYEQSAIDTGNEVSMYSTSRCGYCKKARSYFKSNNIQFTEYNIETDRDAKRRYKQMGATGVPVIFVGNKRMNGFSVSGFNRIYN